MKSRSNAPSFFNAVKCRDVAELLAPLPKCVEHLVTMSYDNDAETGVVSAISENAMISTSSIRLT